ncbi:hypothetical protein F5144DRAFT_229372 [Chaetomium tenue]|uniref:Uncharacterized protein n=1 Tax=Chaetomium tenue TaxID=1854479 RepID=A0ACB7P8C7_9PEZI|nr:hypothetical protein F5144DRAFT_229372 [Chaetomium globosum]
MEPPQGSVVEEKIRLQEHLQRQQQQEQQQQQSVPQSSQSRSPTSGSNTVPMTEEELESSPVHNQAPLMYSPTPSHESPAYAPTHMQIPRVPVPPPAPVPGYTTTPRSPTPPPYSGPSTPAQEPAPAPESQTGGPKPPPRYPGLPALDYRLYNPPLFELSSDTTTIKSTTAHLSTSADALVALIRQQATVPPKPQIHITGRRGSTPNSGRADFSIKLNLLPLLVPEDPRQRMDYLRCVGAGEVAFRGGTKPSDQPEVDGDGSLDAWAAKFVADTASVKAFALERVVVNLDVEWLEGQIRKLVAAMRYPGTISVAFPITHSRVVVQNPDRVNKFITSVTGFFAGKRKYEVVKAVWPFATMPKGSDADGRRCAVQTEEVWWREWRGPIRYAIATKRNGWVTNEDKLEALMEGTPASAVDVDWGPEY